MGTVYNLATDTGSKLVFFQSFPPLGTIDQSSNIFMQRYFVCFQYYVGTNYNYNLIFYGGVLRHGVDTMYISYVTFLSSDSGAVATTSTLNLWAGLDFSTSHSSRDMIGFSSGYGYSYDLFSLYGSAPYNDTANNINGTMDLEISFTSNTGAAALTYYAAAGVYRKYNTGDTYGDEILRKKINFNWCYAVAYSTSTIPIQPTDKIKHNFVNCWIPNVVVWESSEVLSLLLLLFFVASLV